MNAILPLGSQQGSKSFHEPSVSCSKPLELDGESVGYIGAGIDEKYNLEKNVQRGDIFTIGVLKKHRRRGIGARLMLHSLEALKAKGMTRATFGVDNYNPTEAMRLYEKVGFKVKKKDLVFERGLQILAGSSLPID